MSSIGPTLPPHLLSKRKRNDSQSNSDSSETSNKSDAAHGKKQRFAGPSLPSNSTSDIKHVNVSEGEHITSSDSSRNVQDSASASNSGSSSTKSQSKTLGPTLPPANILERPSLLQEDDEDSDDDFGPALPGSEIVNDATNDIDSSVGSSAKKPQNKTGRDDWMLAPPTSGNRTASIDPSKMKNRGFSSGPRAAPKSGGDMSLWTETPEEKRKRLEEEMLGIRKNDQTQANDTEKSRADAKAAELAKKVQAYNDKNRAAPLYSKQDREVDEDDPSKRAFDREKDIGGGKLSHTETKQMLNRATDFGSRFSKGSYL